MRHELYADTLDVVKWSAVVRTVERTGLKHIVHLAMLRPDEGAQEGKKAYLPANPHNLVQGFFAEERRNLAQGGRKSIGRVATLGCRMTPPARISVFDRPFVHSERRDYFAVHFPAWYRLNCAEAPLVFVDPCTSVGAGSKGDKYVSPNELAALFGLRPEPLVLAYVHRGQFETVDALKARIRMMLAATGLRVQEDHYDSDALIVRVATEAHPTPKAPVVRKRAAG